MEQKRTLWIALSAGIFLLVVIGAAYILYAPEAKKNTTAMYQKDSGAIWMAPTLVEHRADEPYVNTVAKSEPEQNADSINPAEVNNTSVISNIATPAEGKTEILEPKANLENGVAQTENVTVIANGGTTIYDLANRNPGSSSVSEFNFDKSNVVAQNKVAETTIRETNATHKVVESKNMIIDSERGVVSSAPAVKASYSSKTAVSEEKPAKTAPKNTVPAKTYTTSKTASYKAEPDRFWVQAASYSTKKAADEARSLLDENKIQCEVFTFSDAKGTLWYRVRVGPYTTKSEANYWKNRIDSIEPFSKNNSFVTNSTVSK